MSVLHYPGNKTLVRQPAAFSGTRAQYADPYSPSRRGLQLSSALAETGDTASCPVNLLLKPKAA